jgi:hypothetical protein
MHQSTKKAERPRSPLDLAHVSMLFSSPSKEEKKQHHHITDKEEASLTADIAEEEAAVAHSHYRSKGTAATHLELLGI